MDEKNNNVESVNEVDVNAVSDNAPDDSAKSVDATVENAKSVSQKERKGKNKITIVLICAVVALLITTIVLVILLIGGKGDRTDTGNGGDQSGDVGGDGQNSGDQNGGNGDQNDGGDQSGDGNQNDGGSDDNRPVVENPLGLAFYLKDDGTYAVSCGEAKYLSEIEIPATYKGKAVTEIATKGFSQEEDATVNLEKIIIHDSITTISECAFYGCSSLTGLHYKGYISQWHVISKGYGWNIYTPYYTIYCTDGKLTK